MRRLLGSRGVSAALTGLVVLLAAGGSYAIASGGGKITACVQHKGSHALYQGKCKKGDKKLSWNKAGIPGPAGPKGATGAQGPIGPAGATGPQGPGASKLVYDATGSLAAPTTTLGNMGPYTVSASCSQPSPGTTTTNVYVTGPSGTLDGSNTGGTAQSGPYPTLNNVDLFGGTTSTSSSQVGNGADAEWLPSTGTSVQTLVTITANGGTGASPDNTCHASIAITPTG